MRLAERLIQQQDAAVSSPAAIRASLPEPGRVFTFQRAVVVDPWADLKIVLNVATPRTASCCLPAQQFSPMHLLASPPSPGPRDRIDDRCAQPIRRLGTESEV